MPPISRETAWSLRAIQFQLMIFKILGIAPFSVHVRATRKNGKAKSLVFSYSKIGAIYNLLLVCCLICNSVIVLPKLKNVAQALSETALSYYIFMFKVMSPSYLMCIVALTFLYGQKSILRIADEISNVDRVLIKYETSITETTLPFCAFYFFSQLTYWVLCIAAVSRFDKFDLNITIASTIPVFLIQEVFMQYTITVRLVKRRFQVVNHILLSAKKINSIEEPAVTSRHILGNCPTVTQLRVLKNVHHSLCKTCDEIQKFYSLPILMCTYFTYFMLIRFTYDIISSLIEMIKIDNIALSNAQQLVMVFLFIGHVINLSIDISKLTVEASRTGQVVHELLSRMLARDVSLQLNQFSLQLLHHRLQFNCCGFFSLNQEFTCSFLNTVIKYLLIIIQFTWKGEPN